MGEPFNTDGLIAVSPNSYPTFAKATNSGIGTVALYADPSVLVVCAKHSRGARTLGEAEDARSTGASRGRRILGVVAAEHPEVCTALGDTAQANASRRKAKDAALVHRFRRADDSVIVRAVTPGLWHDASPSSLRDSYEKNGRIGAESA
jgi:hypothetical protein